MACVPGGKFLRSSSILIPLSASDNVAVPRLSPRTFFISTWTLFFCCRPQANKEMAMVITINNVKTLGFIVPPSPRKISEYRLQPEYYGDRDIPAEAGTPNGFHCFWASTSSD